jgi:hypothetical protein
MNWLVSKQIGVVSCHSRVNEHSYAELSDLDKGIGLCAEAITEG